MTALSPLLFVIVMEALSREFRVASPWDKGPDVVVVVFSLLITFFTYRYLFLFK